MEVNEMFADLSRIVKEQQILIDTIDDNVDESHVRTQEAYENVVQASVLQKEGNCIIS